MIFSPSPLHAKSFTIFLFVEEFVGYLEKFVIGYLEEFVMEYLEEFAGILRNYA
ncbi:unnamed protein product [Ceutorhynchus assimilis]|uniref:Uncharacterized protein n=1 Tax=Ceutorhynchus assimilis TaxID=467358 RepID=A0A9N9MM94_9CUCU|nr:unnamed protein product [Ceutorhynchus assimilis]